MRRRLMNAYLSSVVSISLVLLLVGVASMLLVNAKSVSDYFKENMQVSVLMKGNVSDESALEFRESLENERYIKSTTFVSKEQGQRELAAQLGEDFLDVFETSPIPVSIDITLDAAYVSSDSLEVVKSEISKSPLVDEVVYQRSLVDALNANLSRISLVLGVFIALLLFISFVLINNTVRLTVYSKRFIIHTMKLVGATNAFIRRPFILNNIFHGFIAAIIANLILASSIYYLHSIEQSAIATIGWNEAAIVFGGLIIIGIAICASASLFATNKYLRLSYDDMFK